MPQAVELLLDDRSDHHIRQIWAALDAAGIPSLGSRPHADYHPHVTLSVFGNGNASQVAAALRPLFTTAAGLPLPLTSLGFFLTGEAPAFLGVTPTSRLLMLHRQVHNATEPLVADIWPYYRPDALSPHCTLATGATDRARIIEIVASFPTPVPAHVSTAHLVDLPGGHTRTRLTPA
ncbi:2'-5' RNA ligase family protein [Winogradskya consettensis]|uniref:2'-5' RNA ligase n=1 Tax=Winogradskya consettensis TaxID=113560 RepID=A0A919VQY9_9ACTN|nr:2'-5' RNA ligase family protein [Actinoplanes consettensis]GIM73091.1 2'-5' RNA ligase [Actinoplanes consettensis]